ncbi:hypothetical protein HY523_01160 [Candidatus Berkelbacteria bacterium]|nr:hypothetical protein [Candidatus Berkelbacteria bacterium]
MAQHTPPSPLLRFVLSSLGLWFLVALVVASGSILNRWLQTQLRDLHNEEALVKSQLEQQRILTTELAQRKEAVFDALTASLPDDLTISAYFTWLEDQARRRAVSLTYTFDEESSEFQAFVDATPPGAWAISFDVTGSPQSVRDFHALLEEGIYHVTLVDLLRDTITDDQTLLRSKLYVYGR